MKETHRGREEEEEEEERWCSVLVSRKGVDQYVLLCAGSDREIFQIVDMKN